MLRFLTVLLFAILGVLATDAQARMITDAAGRKVEVPDRITRVLPAGSPASILVYVWRRIN